MLLSLGVGALLVFFGVALFSSRIARPLAAFVSPIGKWVVVVLAVLVWPFWTLPFWLLRYGAFASAGSAGASRAFLVGLRPEPAARRDRRAGDVDALEGDLVEAGMAASSSRASCPTA